MVLHGGGEVLAHRHRQALGNVGALGRVTVERPLALLAFGDLVTDLDFAELAARHRRSGAHVLLASHFERHRLQLGELQVEGERVVGYREKPEKQFLICSGIGLFAREVLRVIPADGTPCGLADLIMAALATGHSVAHWVHGAFWMDVNSPELLAEMDLPPGDGLLGLYQGTPLTERGWGHGNALPDRISLFQRTIEDECDDDEDEIVVAIGETLIHELGHYFGLSEDEIEAIEEQYWRGDPFPPDESAGAEEDGDDDEEDGDAEEPR